MGRPLRSCRGHLTGGVCGRAWPVGGWDSNPRPADYELTAARDPSGIRQQPGAASRSRVTFVEIAVPSNYLGVMARQHRWAQYSRCCTLRQSTAADSATAR